MDQVKKVTAIRDAPAMGVLCVRGEVASIVQVRTFLEESRHGVSESPPDPPDTADIRVFVLPGLAINDAVAQSSMPLPALWMEAEEANQGLASVRVSYTLGGKLQTRELPFKRVKVEAVGNDMQCPSSDIKYFAYISAKAHSKIYRIVNTLFPLLKSWEQEMDRSNIKILEAEASDKSRNGKGDHIRAVHFDRGLLLEHYGVDGQALRATLTVDFHHSCLELQTSLPQDVNLSGNLNLTRCLRSVHSLDEALSILEGHASDYFGRSPRGSPDKSSSNFAIFQSPAKAPHHLSSCAALARDGVALVQACNSAQLRDGAIMLQAAAAAEPGGAAECIGRCALEALVTAAATVLPSNIMGTTEQLSLFTLTVTSILDRAPLNLKAPSRFTNACALVMRATNANPLLLCKVVVALLQRADVRFAAMQQDFYKDLVDAYLRKSSLLTPLANNLLSPKMTKTSSKTSPSASQTMMGTPSPGPSKQQSPLFPRLDTLEPVSTPRLAGTRLRIPRLSLPSPAETSAVSPAVGLTRATRREMGIPGSALSWKSHGPDSKASNHLREWESPRLHGGNMKECSASAEMASIAEALGESLMAMDLTSAVSFKRQANIRRMMEEEEKEEESIVCSPLDPLVPASKQQFLQAHHILSSVESFDENESSCSLSDSSALDNADQTAATSAGISLEGTMTSDDIFEVKILLLQAMEASFPLEECPGFLNKFQNDPSALLSAEILSMPPSENSSSELALRDACLRFLVRLGSRAEGRRTDDDGRSEPHVLLVGIGMKLNSLLGSAARILPAAATQAAYWMSIAAEYISNVETPQCSSSFGAHCLPSCVIALNSLQSGGMTPPRWQPFAWQLFHSLVVVLTAAMRQCSDDDMARTIIGALIGDQKASGVLSMVLDLSLLHEAGPTPKSIEPGRQSSFQRDLLSFCTGLIELIGKVSPLNKDCRFSSDNPGSDVLLLCDSGNGRLPKQMTRRNALNFFAPMVAPGNALTKRVLESSQMHSGSISIGGAGTCSLSPPSFAAVRLRPALFRFLRSAYLASGCPFVSDKNIADHWIRFHFIQFLKLYHNPHQDHQSTFLCREHLACLQAFTDAGRAIELPHIRKRFQQLAVLDFFVREISLEFEGVQPVAGRNPGGTDSRSRRRHPGRTTRDDQSHGLTTAKQSVSEFSDVVSPPPDDCPRSARGRSLPKAMQLDLSDDDDDNEDVPEDPEDLVDRRYQNDQGRKYHAFIPKLVLSSRKTQQMLQDPHKNCGETPRHRSASRDSRREGFEHVQQWKETDRSLSGEESMRHSSSKQISLGNSDVDNAGVSERHGRIARYLGSRLKIGDSWGKSRPSTKLQGKDTFNHGTDVGKPSNERSDANDRLIHHVAMRSIVSTSYDSIPDGLVFSGDLDEDVELLEALEHEEGFNVAPKDAEDEESYQGDEDALSNSDFNSSNDAASTSEVASNGTLNPTDGLGGHAEEKRVLHGHMNTPTDGLRTRVPRLAVSSVSSQVSQFSDSMNLPDSPPPRHVGPAVPRLNITPSMHSSLEARSTSAELEVAAEAERARRKAGRSFLGELEASALGKGKMQAATAPRHRSVFSADFSSGASFSSQLRYSQERAARLIYVNDNLHVQAIVLILSLLLSPTGQLDHAYCDPYPWDRKLQNVPFILHHHLNDPDNRHLASDLLGAVHRLGQPAMRLLRSLCAYFFRPSWYSKRMRISGATGAYATVYRCTLPPWANGSTVVLKILDMPAHIQDRCVQVDFHSEVTILEALEGRPSACQIHDYGLDLKNGSLVLVLKDYRCSLKQWRSAQPEKPHQHLRLYYKIFQEIVVAVSELLHSGVIHFDLKCDNVLLEQLPGVSLEEFWSPVSSSKLPFRVVLGDFGESKLFGPQLPTERNQLVQTSPMHNREHPSTCFTDDPVSRDSTTDTFSFNANESDATPIEDGGMTTRARGTDAFKSPEMLLVGGAPQKQDRRFDRRRQRGAGAASDVWSIGCLLFELMTGRLLFGDTDWLQLVGRVTSPGIQIITEERAAMVKDLPGVLELLQYILVRDPSLRPTLADLLRQIEATLAVYQSRLPACAQYRSRTGNEAKKIHPDIGSMVGEDRSELMEIDKDPLPIAAMAEIAPNLMITPLDMQDAPAALRRDQIRKVAIVISRSTEYDRNTDGQIRLHNRHHLSDLLMERVVSDTRLYRWFEASNIVQADCKFLVSSAEYDDVEERMRWLDASVRRDDTHHTSGRLLVVTAPGCESAAVLFCIAWLVRVKKVSMYQAMLKVSHWGLDLHLSSSDLKALECLNK